MRPMDLPAALKSRSFIYFEQRPELAELFGFETRNKYSIETEDGVPIAFAAEQQKSLVGFLLRQWFGHWRSFEVHFFDTDRRPFLVAAHRFRFFFQRLDITMPDGREIGAVQQRFSVLGKRFDVTDSGGRVLFKMTAPFWRVWNFPFYRDNARVATIEKHWSGLFTEVFTDRDKFRVHFHDDNVSERERALIYACALFIDLQYFEDKAD